MLVIYCWALISYNLIIISSYYLYQGCGNVHSEKRWRQYKDYIIPLHGISSSFIYFEWIKSTGLVMLGNDWHCLVFFFNTYLRSFGWDWSIKRIYRLRRILLSLFQISAILISGLLNLQKIRLGIAKCMF